jgi:RiboL-PSP-HEPN
MTSAFTVLFEEFDEELAAIKILVDASADPKLGRPKARVAGANAATLLLAATFEEYVRELARAFARAVVESCSSHEKLPPRLASVAWRRTMEALARVRLHPTEEGFSRDNVFSEALARFTVTYEFCRGDLSQDIYQDLIHNENNMRPQEINSLFNISGLRDVCLLASGDVAFMSLLGEVEPGKAHGQLLERLEEYFERRNQVAHAINATRSSGPEQISTDIELLRSFGHALCAVLEQQASSASGTFEDGKGDTV